MIRDVEVRDFPKLREMHEAMGMEFEFPEFPMLSAKVWVDADDEPVMMIGAKVMAEAVLLTSKRETPGMRMAALAELSRAVETDCRCAGIGVGVCWIPDEIWKPYHRRLKALGWLESKYRTMCLLMR